jgi:ribonucleoside-diphosphate reductase alpha chain
MKFVREFGEPGFVWSDSTELVVNPCVEIGMYPVDVATGETGWQACNLCEINGKKCKTEQDFAIAAKAAAIIGTCQAGYTDLTYLGAASKRILDKEALLGVSITGMMDNPEILFNPKLQRKMARLILKVNEEIAAKIGINPCARATCVKPAGTTSCILGTASGIHPHHANRYIRRSQANHLEPPLQFFKKFNPFAVEKCVWSANGTDEVISFCIEVPKGAKTKNELDAVKLLEYVKLTQENWVTAGRTPERCSAPWLTHNVSNTITVREDEWSEVTNYIYDHREFFAGVSLLPITGDKDYPQAPFTAIYTPRELVTMYGDGSVMASGLIVDGLHAFDNNLWKACDAALGNGEPLAPPQEPEGSTIVRLEDARRYDELKAKYDKKVDWVRRAKQFASRYFENDIKKMTYCLKDVNNWKHWCDLKREYQDVDYSQMVEEHDNTKLEQTIACAGGACTLSYV